MKKDFDRKIKENKISAWGLFTPVHPGEWIKMALENSNRPLDEFGKDCGLTVERLGVILDESDDPSDEEIEKIQKAIGYKTDFLKDMNKLYKLKKSGAPEPTPG